MSPPEQGTACQNGRCPQHWRGSWAPSAQGCLLSWWGGPEVPRRSWATAGAVRWDGKQGLAPGASGGLSAMPAGDPRVKACSQLPGMQQASQMPAAHTALAGGGRPVSAAPQGGRRDVSSDNPPCFVGPRASRLLRERSESPISGPCSQGAPQTKPPSVCVGGS